MKLSSLTQRRIKAALAEDIGKGDVTSDLLIAPYKKGRAVILAREAGIFAGTETLRAVFKSADPKLKIKFLVKDGRAFRKNQPVIQIRGKIRSILKAERTALNFLAHLSGIATRTRAFVNKIGKRKTAVLDTRKTTPLWREIEKAAVLAGGGKNHRMGLYDAIFVKENHRKFGSLDRLRDKRGKFEMEVRNLKELSEALVLGPHTILFDNFSPAALKRAVRFARRANPRIKLEASGGITLRNIAAYASAGVDQISAGSLTHSVKAIDFSLLIQ